MKGVPFFNRGYTEDRKKTKLLEAQNQNIDSKRFSKQNVPPDNVFRFFETLHITATKHICLTQAVILPSTSNLLSNFIATSAVLCNNMRPQVKIVSNVRAVNSPG